MKPAHNAVLPTDGVVNDWALSTSANQHSVSVDRDLAAAGRCGLIDLRTGLTCVGAHGHLGRCQFVDGHTAAAVLEEYQGSGA
ncbi:MAG: hypothetical protein ACRDY2_07955 [Acidimicrobiales bacterium]